MTFRMRIPCLLLCLSLFSCGSSPATRNATGLQEVYAFGNQVAASIQRACGERVQASIKVQEFESVSISGTGSILDRASYIYPASPILVGIEKGGRNFDCGILWAPCALKVSPAFAFRTGSITIEPTPPGTDLRGGKPVTVQAPRGPAQLQKINCVPL